MHILLIEGHAPAGAREPATLTAHAFATLSAAGDPLDAAQERSLRALGTAVTPSSKVVRIEAVDLLEEPA